MKSDTSDPEFFRSTKSFSDAPVFCIFVGVAHENAFKNNGSSQIFILVSNAILQALPAKLHLKLV
ncbi:MAG: hypothetical protein NVSMB44_17140 [Ktedonobacteraceae bacterium]